MHRQESELHAPGKCLTTHQTRCCRGVHVFQASPSMLTDAVVPKCRQLRSCLRLVPIGNMTPGVCMCVTGRGGPQPRQGQGGPGPSPVPMQSGPAGQQFGGAMHQGPPLAQVCSQIASCFMHTSCIQQEFVLKDDQSNRTIIHSAQPATSQHAAIHQHVGSASKARSLCARSLHGFMLVITFTSSLQSTHRLDRRVQPVLYSLSFVAFNTIACRLCKQLAALYFVLHSKTCDSFTWCTGWTKHTWASLRPRAGSS